jgi:hypothetical protein
MDKEYYQIGFYEGVASQLINKAQAAKIMGISRNNLYNWNFPNSFTIRDLIKYLLKTDRYYYVNMIMHHYKITEAFEIHSKHGEFSDV